MRPTEFAKRLLREEKVALVPGDAFGKCGEGHIRCSYASSVDNLVEALKRIDRFLTGKRQILRVLWKEEFMHYKVNI